MVTQLKPYLDGPLYGCLEMFGLCCSFIQEFFQSWWISWIFIWASSRPWYVLTSSPVGRWQLYSCCKARSWRRTRATSETATSLTDGPPPMWSNPFRKGRHGSSLEVVLKHIQWVVNQVQLTSQLDGLDSCILLCDCAANQLCPGDILRSLIWHRHLRARVTTHQHHSPPGRWHCWRGAPGWSRPSLFNSPRQKSLWFTSLWGRICMASAGFTWKTWLTMVLPWAFFNTGRMSTGHVMIMTLLQVDQWSGQWLPCRGSRTGSSKKALPPIGLGADEHSRLALETQKRPTHFEEVGLVDKNLQFAASELQRHDLRLRELHQHMVKWVLELASRCLAVDLEC